MSFHKITTVLIWSANFLKLANWYKNTFNLKIVEELNHPKDTEVLFEFPDGGSWLWIGQHSDVLGNNPDPCRHMFNITVDSVTKSYAELETKGVKFLATPFKAPTMDRYFATMYDIDGNLVQIIGNK